MDFSIPYELKELKNLVAKFVENEILPLEEEVEERDEIFGDKLRELTKKAIALGLYALNMPTEYGGGGLGMMGIVLVREELGKVILALGNRILRRPPKILLECSEEQKPIYLIPCCKGEKIACFALTEPAAGSDAAAITTSAVRQGNGYVLNGRKHFISDAGEADFAIVFAVTDKKLRARGGITAFLVDKETPGFTLGREQKKMGWAGYPLHELIFEDCLLSEKQTLGGLGKGFELIAKFLAEGRLSLASWCVGNAEKILKLSIDYAKQRVTFGAPLSTRQGIEWMIADSRVEIDAARLLVYHAAWKIDQGMGKPMDTSIAKLYASEMLGRVADRGVQIHGGMGYMKEYPMERMYRDARGVRIGEGTSEMQRHIIARTVLRD